MKCRYLFTLMILALLLSSCEKVIDVDLNAADLKYVIEAVVSDRAGNAKVLITQTKNFNEDNTFPGISGAVVKVTEQGGLPVNFIETSPGVYEAPGLVAATGKTYRLDVSIGNNSFKAVSTMPQKINLDSVYITDEVLFGDTRKTANIEYHDPLGRGNNYRFIQYVNTYKENQIFVANDDYTDGNKIISKLFYFTDSPDDPHSIKSGDQVKIEMFCIDPAVYKYWYSLSRSATGGSGQATPANPVSNLQGGALGYFSVQTYQSKTIIAP